MSSQEYFDPEKNNFYFHSSREERLDLQSERYHQKLEENRLRVRRTKRVILANLVIVLLMVLFISVGWSFFFSRTNISGYRFHVSVVKVDYKRGEVVGIAKIKNINGKQSDLIEIKASFGDQSMSFEMQGMKKGQLRGRELFFLIDPKVKYLVLEIKIEDESAMIRSPINRFSFF